MSKIKKAIIPAAGIGSRFLPWTKAMPKEMLPIINKPVIQYVVEECVEAGIEEIIIVTDSRKRSIEDHFDYAPLLEDQLEKAGKQQQLAEIRKIADMADFIYIRQKGPYGNATPVISSRRAVGNEPFVVVWGDQFTWAQPSRLKQCLDVFNAHQCPTFAAIKVNDEQKKHAGIGRLEPFEDNVFTLKEIVEKPGAENAPSDIMVSGAYLFTPDVFPILENLQPGKGGELWLVDAINQLCRQQQCLAVEIRDGRFQDTGNKLAYHKTVVDFMLEDPEIGEAIKEYFKAKIEHAGQP
ncbi:UTP--glucose-1-phosphate uridylyltransferase [Candidatus Beckwithbacteria bacterium]|nr:UTP--glucose-1-phosphate uridylyltransferase [Candidatus Beckwithbacteria bacterium]